MTDLRRLTQSQIVRQMKRRGVRQVDIAERAGCAVSRVNDVLRRVAPDNALTERVWGALEEALA